MRNAQTTDVAAWTPGHIFTSTGCRLLVKVEPRFLIALTVSRDFGNAYEPKPYRVLSFGHESKPWMSPEYPAPDSRKAATACDLARIKAILA